jgi:hypothetical protein
MLETGDALKWRAEGKSVRIAMPESLRAKTPIRQAYAIKMAGARLA